MEPQSSGVNIFNESSLDLNNLTTSTLTVQDNLNVASATIDSLPTDNSTLQYTGNELSVKQVDTAQIKNGAITSAKLAANAVDANSLSGTTLASNVINSSLTSLGTLTGLNLNGNLALLSTGLNLGSNTIPLTYLYSRNVYSDASLNLYTGGQVVSHSDIYPSSISINIGSAFNKFNNVYALMFNGDCSGNAATSTTSGSCSGNAATATTASSCSGNSATATTASSCSGNSATATTASSCSGNALTATKLQTGRTINGTTFDGSANITITADASTLTNTTLNSTVVSSSLTSVGTLSSLSMGGNITFTNGTSIIGDLTHQVHVVNTDSIGAPVNLGLAPQGNVVLASGKNLLPSGANTCDLGSSSAPFNHLYTTNLIVNALTPVLTLQTVRTTSSAAQSLGANTASYNNTIPTYSSLNNITALQTSFTPKSSSSTLTIKVIINFSTSALEACVFGLFNGTGATNALQTAVITAAAANYGCQAVLFYDYAPGSTSAITFYVAGGGTSASSVFINANSSGTRLMGGALLSSVEITETTA